MGTPRSGMFAAIVVAGALALVSCSSDADVLDAQPDGSDAVSGVTTEPAGSPVAPSELAEGVGAEFVPIADSERSATEIVDASQVTLTYPTIEFTSILSTKVPGLFSGSAARQGTYSLGEDHGTGFFYFGSFDVATLAGVALDGATLRDLASQVEGQVFEYTIKDGVFWQRFSGGVDESTWTGVPAEAFVASTGSDPRLAVDGGIYLTAMLDAVAQTIAVVELEDGSTRWTASFIADVVAPLAAGGGTVQRLFDAGFSGQTSLLSPGLIEIGADGALSSIAVDVSNWWSAAMTAAGEPDDGVEVRLSLSFGEGGQIPEIAGICDDPEIDDSGDVQELTCPADPQ